MADEVMDARTGETVDLSALSDRALLEAVYRQNNDVLGALIDVLKATHAVQGTVSEVLKAAKGEDKPKDGKSMKEEMEAFQEVMREIAGGIQNVAEAVNEVPVKTGDIVDTRVEGAMRRAFEAAPAGNA